MVSRWEWISIAAVAVMNFGVGLWFYLAAMRAERRAIATAKRADATADALHEAILLIHYGAVDEARQLLAEHGMRVATRTKSGGENV